MNNENSRGIKEKKLVYFLDSDSPKDNDNTIREEVLVYAL